MPSVHATPSTGPSLCPLLRGFILPGLLLAPVLALAQTVFVWSGGTGDNSGVFDAPANWTANTVVPGADDTARFDLSDTYTVGVVSNAEVARLEVLAGDVRFDLVPGGNWKAGWGQKIWNSTLRIKDGELQFGMLGVSSYTDLAFKDAHIYLEGGTLKAISTGGTLNFMGSLLVEGHGQLLADLFVTTTIENDGGLQSANAPRGLTIRASGGDLLLGNPARPGYGVMGNVETGGNTVRISSNSTEPGDPSYDIYGSLILGGGKLQVDQGTNVWRGVHGHGTIEQSHGSMVINGMVLDGDLLVDRTTATNNSFPGYLKALVDVGGHRLEFRSAPTSLPLIITSVGDVFVTETSELPTTIKLAGGEFVVTGSPFELSGQRNGGVVLHPHITGYGLLRGDMRGSIYESGVGTTAADPHAWLEPDATLVLTGSLAVGSDIVTVLSAGAAQLQAGGQISGGTLWADHGLAFGAGQALTGYGFIRAAAPAGGLVGSGHLALATNRAFGAEEWTLLSGDAVTLGARLDLAGSTLHALHGWEIQAAGELRGYGLLDSTISGTGLITVADGDLTLGRADSSIGISFGGNVAVGSRTLTLLDSGVARLDGATTINGGTIVSAHGISFGSLTGAGTVAAAVTGGGTITAGGDLALGDATVDTGFDFDGTLHVGAHRVTLLGGDRPAFLGTLTTLSGGLLASTTGFAVDTGEQIMGYGLLLGSLNGSLGSGALTPTGAFSQEEALAIGNAEAWILSNAAALFSSTTTLSGGTLHGTGYSLQLTATGVLNGYGTMQLPLNATVGTIGLSGGVLNIAQGGLFGGTVTGITGSTLRLSGGTSQFLSGLSAVLPTLSVTGGTAQVQAGAGLNAANVAVSGGTLTYANGSTGNLAGAAVAVSGTGTLSLNSAGSLALPASTLVSGNGTVAGTLTGTGNWQLTAGKTFTVDRGTLAGTGVVTVASGAQFDVVASGATLSRDIVNQGTVRMNVADINYSQLFGGGMITNQAGATLRFVDAPLVGSSYNPNGIIATALNVTNAGTVTVGADTPGTGDQPYTLFSTGGEFSNAGSVSLRNYGQLRLLGGGTQTGTFTMAQAGADIYFAGGHSITDTGSTFVGDGYVQIEGGTLHTTPGIYTPGYRLLFVNEAPALPEATGLRITNEFWIDADMPGLALTVANGGQVTWVSGTADATYTVEDGGTLTFTAGLPSFVAAGGAGVSRVDGEIENHGTVRLFGEAEGNGTLRNRSDGVVTNRVNESLFASLPRFMADLINEGLVEMELRDNGLLEFGTLANTGHVSLRAVEAAADTADDVKIRGGSYTQTAGTTTIETTRWNSASLPDASVQLGAVNLLGGTMTATGRLIVTSLLNQASFSVGAAGLNLTGAVTNAGSFSVGTSGMTLAGDFTNANGGTLTLGSQLTQTSGSFNLQAGSRLVLNGTGADVYQNGSALYSGNFITPTGATIVLNNGRHLDGNTAFTTNGTLVIGTGSTFNRSGGSFSGPGEIHVGDGGSMTLSGNGSWGGGGALVIEAGGTLSMDSHDNGLHRFYDRTLINNGTVNRGRSSVGMSATTTITNNGLWIDSGEAGYYAGDGQPGGGVFVNNGTFRKNGVYDSGFASSVVFNNTGVIDIRGTTLALFGTGTLAGSSVVNMAPGTTLLIRDGAMMVNSGAHFNGGLLSLGDASQTTLNGHMYATNASFWGGVMKGSHTLHGDWVMSANANYSTPGTTTIASDGVWSFAPHNDGIHRLYGRTFINDGTVNRGRSNIGMSATTTITNNGLWIDSGEAGYYAGDSQPGGGVFVNNGTFRKNGVYETGFASSVEFNNSGVIEINGTTLGLYGTGTLEGSSVVNMAPGTTLLLRGAMTLNSGAHFNGGTLSLGDGGQTTLNGNMYATNASFWGGVMKGSHTLHGDWVMSANANYSTPGTTTIASDGVWSFAPHNDGIHRLYGRTFINDGTVNRGRSNIGMSATTTITNNGLWIDSGEAGYTAADGQAAGGVFVNNGTFRKNGVYETGFASSVVFNNSGVIEINGTTLGLYGTGTLEGSSVVNMAPGTTLLLRGAMTVNSGIRLNGGTFSLGDGGQTTLNGDIHATNASFWGGVVKGSHTLHGDWVMSANANYSTPGTTTVASDGVFGFAPHNDGIHRLYGRTFINNGTVNRGRSDIGMSATTTITNNGVWIDSGEVGYHAADGQPVGGTFVNNGTFRKGGVYWTGFEVGLNFTNNGTVELTSGPLYVGTLTNRVGNALVGGTWIFRGGTYLQDGSAVALTNNQANLTLYGGAYYVGSALNRNEGTLRLLGGQAFTAPTAFTNTGTLEVGAGSSFSSSSTFTNSGVLTVSGAFSSAGLTNTGTLGGSGTFGGNIVSGGVLAPGNSPGLLAFTGNLTLQATSDLMMEMGGLVEGVSYDSIDVGGTFALGGDLNILLIDAFKPTSGATFNLFDAATLSGTFASISLPTLTAGLSWNTSALYTSGVLSVTGTAIPEPSTHAALAGLAALGWAWCQRRSRTA